MMIGSKITIICLYIHNLVMAAITGGTIKRMKLKSDTNLDYMALTVANSPLKSGSGSKKRFQLKFTLKRSRRYLRLQRS